MTVRDEARSLLDSILGYRDNAHGASAPKDRGPKIGVVDPSFNPGVSSAARVTFDGESTMSVRPYPWLGAAPRPGDRVVLIPVGRSFVIAGPIGGLGDRSGPYRWQMGTATNNTAVAAGAGVDIPITFAAGRFTVPPLITGATPANGRFSMSTSSVTTTGAVLRASNLSSGAGQLGSVAWKAEQATPTTAAG